MLNDKDINRLTSVLATKSDVEKTVFASESRMLSVLASKQELSVLKEDLEDLKELVHGLIVSTDGIAKAINNLSTEYAAISTQLSRHEKWIKEIAEKVGLKLATE